MEHFQPCRLEPCSRRRRLLLLLLIFGNNAHSCSLCLPSIFENVNVRCPFSLGRCSCLCFARSWAAPCSPDARILNRYPFPPSLYIPIYFFFATLSLVVLLLHCVVLCLELRWRRRVRSAATPRWSSTPCSCDPRTRGRPCFTSACPRRASTSIRSTISPVSRG